MCPPTNPAAAFSGADRDFLTAGALSALLRPEAQGRDGTPVRFLIKNIIEHISGMFKANFRSRAGKTAARGQFRAPFSFFLRTGQSVWQSGHLPRKSERGVYGARKG
jgi:hypothetical protein